MVCVCVCGGGGGEGLVGADNASYLCTCPFIESLSLYPALILRLVAKLLPPVSKNCR